MAVLLYWKWSGFEQMKAADWGSFLQGAFSPPALLWLILGFALQKIELELQRTELTENNRTQSAQQIAMAQQAELIAKQFALAEMRNHWDLDIAIVAASMAMDPIRKGLHIVLVNEGANGYVLTFSVRNVTNGATVNPHYVAHLPRNGRAEIWVMPDLNAEGHPYLDVSFLRADGVNRSSSYLIDTVSRLLQPTGTKSL
jgi:hypothetical protein